MCERGSVPALMYSAACVACVDMYDNHIAVAFSVNDSHVYVFDVCFSVCVH